MAENLGTAVLRLEVDDTALREGLAEARRLVENTSADVGRRGRSGSSSRSPGPTVDFSKTVRAERQLAAERNKTAADSIKASKAELQQQQVTAKRRRDILSNAIIGGAFPALFGQGLGASVGGAAGGAAGGAIGGQFGFGLSLVGTALGAQFDAAIQKATVLGAALDNPIGQFSALQQSALLSSKGLERQIESLIAVGREAEAAALIQKDLAQSYGGAEAAQRLVQEQDRLGRSWAQLSVGLAQLSLPFIADAAQDAAEALNGLRAILEFISRFKPPGLPDLKNSPLRPFFNPLSGGFGTAALLSGLGALAPKQPDAAASPAVSTGVDEKRKALLSEQFRLITAQVQGYKKLSLEAEREISLRQEAVDIENLRARKAGAPEIEARRQQGTLERFRIAEQLPLAKKDEETTARNRLATSTLDVAQNRLALESVRERIAAARQLGSLEEGVARSTLETALNIRASVAEAKRREQDIGAQIDAARIRGGDAGEAEASRLVDAQRVAAEETKLRIIEGANTLRQTGQSLKQAIIDGANRYRGVLEGSFNLLRSGVQERLVAQARNRIDYSLFDERKLRSPQDLFSAASASEQLRDIDKQIADSSKALATVNTELVSTNKQLTEAVAALVQKDWSVNAFISPSTDSVTQSELLRASSLP